MNVIVVGDFSSGTNTGAAIADAFEALGADVARHPEMAGRTWDVLARPGAFDRADVFVWAKSRTLAQRFDQASVVGNARRADTPTVSIHMDKWWGLGREPEVFTDPFFTTDWVLTTDGGNDERWSDAGVNHVWIPPATITADTRWEVTSVPMFERKAVFVGSWERYAHPEWTYRRALVTAMRRAFGPSFLCVPGKTGRRVHGQALANIVASAAVVVGDSCLVDNATRYWSDRIPLVLGMGGVLAHPAVEGLDEFFTSDHYLPTPVGDIPAMVDTVSRVLESGDHYPELRANGRNEVRERHTFERRAELVVDLVAGVGCGAPPRVR